MFDSFLLIAPSPGWAAARSVAARPGRDQQQQLQLQLEAYWEWHSGSVLLCGRGGLVGDDAAALAA